MKYDLPTSDFEDYNKIDMFEYYDIIKKNDNMLITIMVSVNDDVYLIDTYKKVHIKRNYTICNHLNFKSGNYESYKITKELLPLVRREKINKILKR